MQENYQIFKKILGHDFDSLASVFEIGDEKSEFWTKVSQDSVALGILLGYGIKNASCFYWKHFYKPIEKTMLLVDSLQYKWIGDAIHPNASLEEFSLPRFASFFDDDEMIKNYEREREEIKKIYRNKDFVEFTLQKLTSSR